MTFKNRLEQWRSEKRAPLAPTKATEARFVGFEGVEDGRFLEGEPNSELLAGSEAVVGLACSLRGEPQEAVSILAEMACLPPADQRDLLAHFKHEVFVWSRATGSEPPTGSLWSVQIAHDQKLMGEANE